MNKNELRRYIKQRLACGGIESPDFEAGQLAEYLMKTNLDAEEVINKRLSGEPLQYILGEWEFMGLTLKVGEGVLIPRQDTELLAEAALELLKKSDDRRVLDLCAGSGCIGISLARYGNAEVTLFEKSPKALKYIESNLSLCCVNAKAVEWDVLTDPPKDVKAFMMVSNPPYIKTEILAELQEEVKHEPTMALDGGSDGLAFYKAITKKWKNCLTNGGYLLYEIGFDQSKEVEEILKSEGFKNVKTLKDLCGLDRVVMGQSIV